VSVINPNETARTWKASKREPGVHLYLSGVEGDAAALVGTRVAGFPLSLSIVPVVDKIEADELGGAAAKLVGSRARPSNVSKRSRKKRRRLSSLPHTSRRLRSSAR
jgi:hypothetical protein